MIKTCLQCGAINQAQDNSCCFCDAPLDAGAGTRVSYSVSSAPTRGNLALDPDWREELSRRLNAYRARRRKLRPHAGQTELAFAPPADVEEETFSAAARAPESSFAAEDEEFAFSIGIGRRAAPLDQRDSSREVEHVAIDVTAPERSAAATPEATGQRAQRAGSPFFPVASLAERSLAALLDAIFLLFSYGGFLTLFGSLGGHFTFSKFSLAVYAATLALFYVQYFALFTVFGGTTPGMMLRGLHVVGFSGEPPSPRQLIHRSFGYLVSGGTFFLGFFWALWDEDHLTWQDRMSHTYLTPSIVLPHTDALAAHGDSAGAASP